MSNPEMVGDTVWMNFWISSGFHTSKLPHPPVHWRNCQLSSQSSISLLQLLITFLLSAFRSLSSSGCIFHSPLALSLSLFFCLCMYHTNGRQSRPLFLSHSIHGRDTVHFPLNLYLMSFFCLCFFGPSSQCNVSSKGTHHVNMRQTSVLISITTWLNMAECVRWIALWRSFCREMVRQIGVNVCKWQQAKCCIVQV